MDLFLKNIYILTGIYVYICTLDCHVNHFIAYVKNVMF